MRDPTPIHYWRRFELTASLTTWPRCTPCITAAAPVMMLGSLTPSPLQSYAPLSTTRVGLPTTVFAPDVAGGRTAARRPPPRVDSGRRELSTHAGGVHRWYPRARQCVRADARLCHEQRR